MIEIDTSNLEQARAWDGDEGRYWADHASQYDDAVARYHRVLLDTAAVGRADCVVDLGCGAGQTTCDAARLARDGAALGLDLSSAMIEVARRRAELEQVANASFEQADAQVHVLHGASLDLVISRFGAMFFGDPVRAFSNIAGWLRPRGRLALLSWQPSDRNEWLRAFATALTGGPPPAPPADAPGPCSLAAPERVRSLLHRSGFTDVQLVGRQEPLRFGRDPHQAGAFVLGQLGWMLAGQDAAGRARALDRLRASLQDHQAGDGVLYGSAAWLVTARRA